jgi:hypothetical protein
MCTRKEFGAGLQLIEIRTINLALKKAPLPASFALL